MGQGIMFVAIAGRIGKWATLATREGARHTPAQQFAIRVKVKDARYRFGITDFLVEPESGAGSLWVSGDRLSFDTVEGASNED